MTHTADPALKRTLAFAMLLAMALVLHVLEGALPPPLPFPGVKLGLSNLMTVVTMLLLGPWAGIGLAATRSALGGLIAGTFLSVGFFLSLGGGVASAVAVALALRWLRPGLSLVGVSIVGALVHNTAQLALAWAAFVQQGALFYYLPVLWVLALISGTATGLVLSEIERRGVLTSVAGRGMLTEA